MKKTKQQPVVVVTMDDEVVATIDPNEYPFDRVRARAHVRRIVSHIADLEQRARSLRDMERSVGAKLHASRERIAAELTECKSDLRFYRRELRHHPRHLAAVE